MNTMTTSHHNEEQYDMIQRLLIEIVAKRIATIEIGDAAKL